MAIKCGVGTCDTAVHARWFTPLPHPLLPQVFHAHGSDCKELQAFCGVQVVNVVDTQVAYHTLQHLRETGRPPPGVGLPYITGPGIVQLLGAYGFVHPQKEFVTALGKVRGQQGRCVQARVVGRLAPSLLRHHASCTAGSQARQRLPCSPTITCSTMLPAPSPDPDLVWPVGRGGALPAGCGSTAPLMSG